jgi:hypothetical protein
MRAMGPNRSPELSRLDTWRIQRWDADRTIGIRVLPR